MQSKASPETPPHLGWNVDGHEDTSKDVHTVGDGLNTTAKPALCAQMIERAESTRREMGRERSEVTYSSQTIILVGSDSEIEDIIQKEAKRMTLSPQDLRDKLKDAGCITGTAERCAESLRAYKDAGVDYLVSVIIGDRLLWPIETVRDRLLPLL